ncbi:protein SODIUM POTASSIUM ROOT DEFECTIVE 2-like, partial [Gossypium hirsutum]|uniref:Protein SODIUM POTASSIUM ROOT DEFECTIVE 2-like n=1 Tax=Gossypium hirsutum TaxID=3635 RepID=A0ABM2YHK9_GOSHI
IFTLLITTAPIIPTTRNKPVKPSDVRRKSSAHIHDLTSPPTNGSTRYLLSDRPFIDCLSDSDHVPAKPKHVVVLRVSIHCKGCKGKVRKQIPKMEGVTSFSIDLATKKVTVIGDVIPSSVLESVSKVKNARLWSSPSASPPVVKPITD